MKFHKSLLFVCIFCFYLNNVESFHKDSFKRQHHKRHENHRKEPKSKLSA